MIVRKWLAPRLQQTSEIAIGHRPCDQIFQDVEDADPLYGGGHQQVLVVEHRSAVSHLHAS